MSDTFASEFQKWLETKTSGNGESTEESDNDSEYAMNTYDKDDSEYGADKLLNQLSNKQGHLISHSISGQAPILVDDDDDDIDGGHCDDPFPNAKQQFEDEPPILEPVSRQLPDYNMPHLGLNPQLPPSCMRDYSRYMHHRRSSLQKYHTFMRTYSNKDKAKNLSEGCNRSFLRNVLKSKDMKGSGNIFDKLNSDIYEQFPPPLIPSPEALRLHLNSEYKHSSHSPDFCAMEADSTSEIEDKASGSLNYRRISKSSVNCEATFECDSTCMPAASPVIVSPASVSHGDIHEVRDPGGGSKNDEMHSSDSLSQNFDDYQCADDLQLSVITEPTELDCDRMIEANSESSNTSSMLQAAEGSQSHYCPQLFVANTCNTVCQSFSLNTSNETGSNNICGFPNEPPILSVISPSLRSHRSRRKKRHTVDSPDNYCRSEKAPYTMTFLQDDTGNTDFDMLTPPTLTHVSETVTDFCYENEWTDIVPQHAKKCHSRLEDKKLHGRRRKKRSNTFPFTDLTQSSSHLSDDLHNFVIGTLQLSQLQTHMHMLVYQLFPTLRLNLDSMSPESAGFKMLLSDIVMSLEQTSVQDSSSSSSLILDRDMKHSFVSERPVSNILQVGCTSQSAAVQSSSQSSSHDYQAACTVQHKSDASALSVWTNNSQCDTHKLSCHLVRQKNYPQVCDSDLAIPQLSLMTLKDVEELIKPSKVVLFRDPNALLEEFSELCCRALQLLLPDLTVSLCNELARFPHDLIIFIDNVIVTNSR